MVHHEKDTRGDSRLWRVEAITDTGAVSLENLSTEQVEAVKEKFEKAYPDAKVSVTLTRG